MIKRINFIEKKAFVFTYASLLKICVLILSVLILLNMWQMRSLKKLTLQKQEREMHLKEIEVERDELLKKPIRAKVSVGQYQELLNRVQAAPRISKVFVDLTQKMPNSIWITHLKVWIQAQTTGTTTASPTVKPADKNKKGFKKGQDEKKDAPVAIAESYVAQFETDGMATEMRLITEFVTALGGSPFFKKLVLVDSTTDTYGYSFKIKSEMNQNAK